MASIAPQRSRPSSSPAAPTNNTSNIPATFSPHIAHLLNTLHAESLAQEHAIDKARWSSIRAQLKSANSSKDHDNATQQMDELMLDKFIALDQDKCLFIYNTLLAIGAEVVVEAGTSFGVSTIYLALAVAKCGGRDSRPRVIATEKEEQKAEKARGIWKQCGMEVEDVIDLRVGDLQETLKEDLGGDGQFVDALLLDIWPYVAVPALKLVQSRMRRNSVVFVDNTISSREGYQELLSILRNPSGPWRSVTLPFSGGLEMAVYQP
ncbi:uncharacterized protein AB675_1427 [Cyphellophora attinorum]|uniref:O-methyltransferase MdmC n=1 Tax=Cyphellophora attinorum TaxID=1664694 RepID=A0A0N1H4Z1_9EURO|nr:uncharacterized protein AB675_1427 [Phialophora attinorum]KPI37266.1 hypothetical protein AB675_1427 [Phialophora attinorum]